MISDKVQKEIFDHARRVYPRECCGVIAQRSRVIKYFPCENIFPEPENLVNDGFEINPVDYQNAEAWGTITHIVHSHPGDGCTTRPSAWDTASCNESQLPWVIVSLPEGDLRIVEPREMEYKGRPWVLGIYDCWGLVMSFYQREFNIELPDFRIKDEWWRDGKLDLYRDNWEGAGFYQVDSPGFGDVMIMQLSAPVWNHGAVFVGNNKILHHPYKKLSKHDIMNGWYYDHTKIIARHKGVSDEVRNSASQNYSF